METYLKKAKNSSKKVAVLKPKVKSDILIQMADNLEKNWKKIVEENEKDIVSAKQNSLSNALLDRLYLNQNRIQAMAKSIR